MSNNRRPTYLPIAIIAVVIIVIAAAVIVWFKPDNKPMATQQSLSASPTDKSESTLSTALNSEQTEQTALAQSQSAFVTGLERLPRSLRDTQVDGEIIINENKQLVVTEGLRRLFDYFLSALGEEEEATIYARVESYIRHHTPEPAASQAVAIFGNYVAYLKALPEIEKHYGNLQLQATKNGELDLNAITQQKQDVASLRQQYFDKTTIEAFFGASDSYDDYSMEMVRINQNEQMSEAQKQAARQDYVSRLPDGAIKTNIMQQANLNELMARTEQMKAAGSSPEALYNMRRELVGAPAAERLAQVDQEDANFDQRFQQLQSQKQQILAQTTDKAKAQIQITQLEKQLFNNAERKRLTGYAALQKSELE
ncbi:lipase secretion chaperone [Psychrobacter sp. Ps3]|uniref:lipase secretion chaperone n=1 Tax=Psychrobacter sp. Ps3 TaxID=2790957 RepID=UPI001EDF5A69|nr:lipase secretion chaperone [Psychrobacter sp. Ps3]MCG3882385.1 lipase secretion chaperone [Psychrobacter sp. Ps3]